MTTNSSMENTQQVMQQQQEQTTAHSSDQHSQLRGTQTPFRDRGQLDRSRAACTMENIQRSQNMQNMQNMQNIQNIQKMQQMVAQQQQQNGNGNSINIRVTGGPHQGLQTSQMTITNGSNGNQLICEFINENNT